ncbi:hypothetical protein MSP8887_00367 [Marinomonas spartinae]|nr:GNAT family N-acetyltransferase [Marinomonas spartinae]SBS26257.1 hypothetical protein MSP8887_00367 [Marinomonas spartinae]
MEYTQAVKEDGYELAEIRALAMRPGLEVLGRFDEKRVRSRFLETFTPSDTFKIVDDETLLGFFVVRVKADHHYLDHLYIKPEHQGRALGKLVLQKIVSMAHKKGLPVRLGALKGSRSNDFYINNGFIKTHEEEFDIYYESPA